MLGSDFLRHHWPAITISLTAATIACVAIVMLFSMPPHRIAMATGPEGDAYYEIGQRYRAALAGANVDVQLVQTAGSVENRALLRDTHSGVSVALIEGWRRYGSRFDRASVPRHCFLRAAVVVP
jgi:hypothetical protein